MVVGEDEAVWRDDDTGAVASEVDYGFHDGIAVGIELSVGQAVAFFLHLLIDSLRQIGECPHAFVGCGALAAEEYGCQTEQCVDGFFHISFELLSGGR